MIHNDPILWQLFNNIATRADEMRQLAAQKATAETFPPELKVKASMLAYHLRQAYNEARLLAGEKPEGAPAAAGGAR